MQDDVLKKLEELDTLIEQHRADGLDPNISADAYKWLLDNGFKAQGEI